MGVQRLWEVQRQREWECRDHSSIHSFIHSFTHSFIHPFIHPFTHPFIHSNPKTKRIGVQRLWEVQKQREWECRDCGRYKDKENGSAETVGGTKTKRISETLYGSVPLILEDLINL